MSDIFNFGELAGVIQSAQQASANQNISPIVEGIPSSAHSIIGSTADAVLISQAYLGSDNEFLWGLDTWDDMQHKVII